MKPRRALVTGLAVGAAVGALARRWWDRRIQYGPWGSLGIRLPGGVDGVGLALLQTTATSLLEGNSVEWREDAEVFDAMEEAIRAARRSVHFDVYIWKPGGAGDRIAELVCRRAREGLHVRILVDPMGSAGFDRHLHVRLVEAGCEVRYFRPLKKNPFAITGRNHRKLIVVDGRVGFTGGFGIAPEWSTGGPDSPLWRDSNVEVRGPVVKQMQVAFANHWVETGGWILPAEELEPPGPAGDARAAYVTSTDVVGLSHARWVTHIALAAAERRAWIANAYFVPPPEVLGTLCARRESGIDVRLLLSGPYQDHPSVRFAQRRLYSRLDRRGVKAYEYLPSMMHAKTMLIDDRLSVVGSMNLDFLSMEWLEEGALIVDDPRFADSFAQRWKRDMALSRQVTAQPPRGEGETVRREGAAAESAPPLASP
jgi:cardiolipin synthase